MKKKLQEFLNNQKGAALVEYTIILGAIILVSYATIQILDINITKLFTAVADSTNSSGHSLNGSAVVS